MIPEDPSTSSKFFLPSYAQIYLQHYIFIDLIVLNTVLSASFRVCLVRREQTASVGRLMKTTAPHNTQYREHVFRNEFCSDSTQIYTLSIMKQCNYMDVGPHMRGLSTLSFIGFCCVRFTHSVCVMTGVWGREYLSLLGPTE
jgi:hypothetical protein